MIKRLASLLPVALGVVILVSLMIHVVPGDPVDSILGPYATSEQRVEMRAKLDLDKPIVQQIFDYLRGITTGDLGSSIIYQKPVANLIAERVRPTLELAAAAVLVAILVSIPLGILAAVYANRAIDFFAMGVAMVGIAIPNFWLGPLLILLFSVELGWLPVSERTNLSSYILPSVSLGLALAAALSRMTRTSVLDCLREDYVRTARAKGNSEFRVVCKHVLRNASLPLITIIGLQFGVLLTGAIITERVFDWPGLGTLILEGIYNRDYPIVQGCVLVFSATYLLVNLVTDLLYAAADPRIRLS